MSEEGHIGDLLLKSEDLKESFSYFGKMETL